MRVYQFRHIRAAADIIARGTFGPIRVSAHTMADLTRVASSSASSSALALAARRSARSQDPARGPLVAGRRRARAAVARRTRQPASARSRSRWHSRRRLEPGAPASISHLRTLASAQRDLAGADRAARAGGAACAGATASSPTGSRSSCRARSVDRLARAPGRRGGLPERPLPAAARPQPAADRRAGALGAGPRRRAGAGMKIGIIDDGIDQSHPFFAPAGYTMPAGFPKGETAFTTAKVIVARAFPPASAALEARARPFDPEHSGHATHVAGIAAGQRRTRSPSGGGPRLRRRAARVPRQLQGADDPDRRRASGSTATRPRSSPRSRRRSGTAWT